MRGLQTIEDKDLEKVVNHNEHFKLPFVFWNKAEIEDLTDPLHVLTVIDKPPVEWKEKGAFFTFHLSNPSEFKEFKKWAIVQVDSEANSKLDVGFAIVRREHEYISVQAYTK